MKEKQVTVFQQGGELLFAILIEKKGGGVKVLTENGEIYSLKEQRILGAFDLEANGEKELSDLAGKITSDASKIIESIDLRDVWKSVPDNDTFKTVRDIGKQYYSDIQAPKLYALIRVLIEDKTYFSRSGPRFRANTKKAVEEKLAERKKAKERRRFRIELVDWLREVLSKKDIENIPGKYKSFLNRMEEFLYGNDDEFVSEILGNLEHSGSLKETAYDILIKTVILNSDTVKSLALKGIRQNFPEKMLEEARKISSFKAESERVKEVFSIDGKASKEIDDAFSVSRHNGQIEVGIHIADLSSFLNIENPLDETAYERAESIYLPTTTVTMLPEILTCRKASLCEGNVRPVISFCVFFDKKGEILDTDIKLQNVRIFRNLTYKEADSIIESGKSDMSDKLTKLDGLAGILLDKRKNKGAVTINKPHVVPEIENGNISPRIVGTGSPSRSLVKEMMIVANRMAAKYTHQRDIPFIYRIQKSPELEKKKLKSLLSEQYNPLKTGRLLRAINPAKLSLEPDIHSGIGHQKYAQITAPLRRYRDLVNQRQLRAALKKEDPPYGSQKLLEIKSTVSRKETKIRHIQAQKKREYLLKYLDKNKDREYKAVVLEERKEGYRVELSEVLLKGILRTRNSYEPGERIKVGIEKIRKRDKFLGLTTAS